MELESKQTLDSTCLSPLNEIRNSVDGDEAEDTNSALCYVMLCYVPEAELLVKVDPPTPSLESFVINSIDRQAVQLMLWLTIWF